jgi:hypothetical protein
MSNVYGQTDRQTAGNQALRSGELKMEVSCHRTGRPRHVQEPSLVYLTSAKHKSTFAPLKSNVDVKDDEEINNQSNSSNLFENYMYMYIYILIFSF